MNLRFAKGICVHFRKLGRCVHGLQIEKDIWIDLSKEINPGRIYLHELLHVQYPKKSEREIHHLEKVIWKKILI